MERTLLIIKPDGVERGLSGEILRRVEREGFTILDLRMVSLAEDQAREFYRVHEGKPFYDDLVSYVSSGSIVVACLGKENAVSALRALVGATNPRMAQPGSLRSEFGLDVQKNTVHAADSAETAEQEIRFFFGDIQSQGEDTG